MGMDRGQPAAAGDNWVADEIAFNWRPTLKRRVLLRYDAGDGQVEESAEIVDVRTRGGAEYLLLSSGTEVRLDRVVSMDGLPFRQPS